MLESQFDYTVANAGIGRLVLRSCTNSTPIIKPLPLTSPMLGWRAPISLKQRSMSSPCSAAFCRPPFSSTSSVASAATHAIGLPPYVLPWALTGHVLTLLRANNAA